VNSMLDILTASIIGAVLLLVGIKAMDNAVQHFVNHNADAISQNKLSDLNQIIQADLRKMGYGIHEAEVGTIIQTAQPTHLVFLSNLNLDFDYYIHIHGNQHLDNIPDTIEYIIAPFDTVVFIDTSLVLYQISRTVKVTQESIVSGVVGIIANNTVFRYLDQGGEPAPIQSATRMVEVTLVTMNPEIYRSSELLEAGNPGERMNILRRLIQASYWRQTRVISKNLRR